MKSEKKNVQAAFRDRVNRRVGREACPGLGRTTCYSLLAHNTCQKSPDTSACYMFTERELYRSTNDHQANFPPLIFLLLGFLAKTLWYRALPPRECSRSCGRHFAPRLPLRTRDRPGTSCLPARLLAVPTSCSHAAGDLTIPLSGS